MVILDRFMILKHFTIGNSLEIKNDSITLLGFGIYNCLGCLIKRL